MARFLAKVVLTLEPNLELNKYHEEIREITAHHKRNLLNLIGVDPVVYRSETSLGDVDLQVWITTTTSHPLNQIIIPFYYLGARKYIFLCNSKKGIDFVSDVIELAEDNLNALYEFAIITPSSMNRKVYSRLKTKFRKLFSDKNLQKYSFYQMRKSKDLLALFDMFSEDIVVNRPRPGDRIPVNYDLNAVEKIALKQGFRINENHQVSTQIDDINFVLDLKFNNVYAEISNCGDCDKECKVRKKLCIVIDIPGYSKMNGLGDYRMISILVAIKDRSILDLKGKSPEEDITAQLDVLRKIFKKTCKNLKKKISKKPEETSSSS